MRSLTNFEILYAHNSMGLLCLMDGDKYKTHISKKNCQQKLKSQWVLQMDDTLIGLERRIVQDIMWASC